MQNNIHSQLLSLSVLGKPYGFSSGSFSFINIVLTNATPMFVKEVIDNFKTLFSYKSSF
ncbi:MAG: hypothetical protein ACJA2M_001574 [Polaribacter sp.]|jgi:hypothetical protein